MLSMERVSHKKLFFFRQVITRQESAAILELVCRETGAQAGNVKIIPVN